MWIDTYIIGGYGMARSTSFLNLAFDDSTNNDAEFKKPTPFANSETYSANIVDASKLSQGDDVKPVFDVTLNTECIEYCFQPGDTIGVFPENNRDEINEIFERLNVLDIVDKKYRLSLIENTTKKKTIPAHLPVVGTLRDVFLNHLDIRCPPKKVFLGVLAKYTANEDEAKKIDDLRSPKNSEQYIKFISNEGRTLLGFLRTFESCSPPIEHLLEHLPPLLPRPYSISSSPLTPNTIHFIFSVVQFTQNLKGVCTRWLEDICNDFKGKRIQFYFRKPTDFRLPEDESLPIIMVGPGTGVAPFVGFLQHRYLQDRAYGESWLVFGCRYKSRDYLFKSEIENYCLNGTLSKLSVAFSRDSTEKVHVQDLIKKNSEKIYDWFVNRNGIIYICGDVRNMCKDVKNAIISCLIECGYSEADAEDFIKEKIKCKKYIEDKWL